MKRSHTRADGTISRAAAIDNSARCARPMESASFSTRICSSRSLPRGILRRLTDDEMEAYRAPYRDRERRLPTLIWPRELPIDGDPKDVVAIVDENARWLGANDRLPKLFINGDPGVIQTGRLREAVRAFPNQREVTVKGLHHLQEDSPKEIGEALRTFVLGKGI
jgi:haloalkane dehalogenase